MRSLVFSPVIVALLAISCVGPHKTVTTMSKPELMGGGGAAGLLSAHPPGQERIRRLNETARSA